MKQISKDLFVGPQILPHHVADLARAGVKTIICNRPDGETADQPDAADIAAAAARAGLAFHYIPVVPGRAGPAEAAAFADAMRGAAKPVLAYCRSGARAAALASALPAAA